jgi:DNA-binding PadR family transcriptional regulator
VTPNTIRRFSGQLHILPKILRRRYLATRATITLTDILVDVAGEEIAVTGRDGQDVLRRVGEASVLILISLADQPRHGYALIQDIKELADVELGPGTLYGALDRLERLGLIEPLPADDRRHPYRITAPGAAALRVHLDSLERVSAAGRLRLQLGGI